MIFHCADPSYFADVGGWCLSPYGYTLSELQDCLHAIHECDSWVALSNARTMACDWRSFASVGVDRSTRLHWV